MENQNETKHLTKILISRAEKGKHINFKFITNLQSYRAIKKLYKATIEVSNGFKTESDKFLDTYINSLKSRVDDVQLLVNHRYFSDYAEFYKIEADYIKNRLTEYEAYVACDWKITINQLLGRERSDEDLVDFSGHDFVESEEEDELINYFGE